MIIQIQPFIDKRDIDTVSKYLSTTWVTEGPATKDFEKNFQELTGAKYAHAFMNGTMTLFTALKVLGIGPGDEVIVPSLTFIASVNSVILAGATPVVVDCFYESLCLDPNIIRKNITRKTKAIMPVHLYGLSADMDAIMKIAKEYGIPVVEDAAQGVGVRFNKRHVGTFGDFGSFSFYGNKTITTGEGGMLVTNKKSFAERAYQLKNHGRKKKGVFKHEAIGYNFSISDMQSALGVSQLAKLDEIINAKKDIYEFYKEQLKNIKEAKFYTIDERTTPVHWFTNILVKNAPALSEKMAAKGVQTRLAFYPIKRQPCYQNTKQIRFSKQLVNDDKLYKNVLSLPSYVGLTKEQLATVVDVLKESI